MMDETEKKALARVNEVLREANRVPATYLRRGNTALVKALCRAIEQHEAFKRDVSDAVTTALTAIEVGATLSQVHTILSRFILPKPVDPLVEALDDLKDGRADNTTESYAACLRAALAARGLEVREIEEDA